MRFDSVEYLAAWQHGGPYPTIHDHIASVVSNRVRGTSVIDLGACTGLLTARLAGQGFQAIGVEGSLSAIQSGRTYGVGVDLRHLVVTRETLPQLGAIIRAASASVLVARRCLPEILGETDTFDNLFGEALLTSGIREVVLEGRVESTRSTHRLKSVHEEVAVLAPLYRLSVRDGSVAYLEASC